MIIERSRRWLYRHFFSSLAGATVPQWRRLIREGQGIDQRYLPRAAFVSFCSIGASLAELFDNDSADAEVSEHDPAPDPLFVVGHWRTGTTHLHELLALDGNLRAPTMIEALFPTGFPRTGLFARLLGSLLPRDRMVDAMPIGAGAPWEDEFALLLLTGMSPYLGWTFPRRREWFDRYLSFEEVSQGEVDEWKGALGRFASRLQRGHRRRLVLKSPPHTARIRLILERFPNARFALVHRDPLTVYMSTRRLLEHGIDGLRLQRPIEDPGPSILARGATMFRRWKLDRSLLGPGQHHEVAFDELERSPLATLARLYDALDLGNFEMVRPRVEQHLADRSGYAKNAHPPIQAAVREKVEEAWGEWGAEWGYPLDRNAG